MQRLRLTFTRGEEAKYVSHLDLARLWERAVRRARLPLAYSAGFTPHPRLSFAAPLAVGLTSDGELLELYLTEPSPPAEVQARLGAQLPPGLALLSVVEEADAPSLQSRVRAALYLARFRTAIPDLAARVAAFLARERVPYERKRERKGKTLDLRPYVEQLAVIEDGQADLIPWPPSPQGKGEPQGSPPPAGEGTGERSASLPLPAQARTVSTPDDCRGGRPADDDSGASPPFRGSAPGDRPSARDIDPHPSPLPGRERESTSRVEPGGQVLCLRLRFDAAGSVRPDEVLDALGLGEQPVQLHRVRLVLE